MPVFINSTANFAQTIPRNPPKRPFQNIASETGLLSKVSLCISVDLPRLIKISPTNRLESENGEISTKHFNIHVISDQSSPKTPIMILSALINTIPNINNINEPIEKALNSYISAFSVSVVRDNFGINNLEKPLQFD